MESSKASGKASAGTADRMKRTLSSDGAAASSVDPQAKVLVQQCLCAKLLVRPATETIPDQFVQINRGIIVFVCFLKGATADAIHRLAKLVLNVRLSETDDGKLVSVLDLPGEVLVIPQGTLGGRVKGTAMQYHKNIQKAVGEELYDSFVQECKRIVDSNSASVENGCGVLCGTYGNRQVLSLETNGPYSHVIEI